MTCLRFIENRVLTEKLWVLKKKDVGVLRKLHVSSKV